MNGKKAKQLRKESGESDYARMYRWKHNEDTGKPERVECNPQRQLFQKLKGRR